MTTNVFSQEKDIIAGENRFETSIEISKSWETSKNAILVNSSATSDMLCATVLASQLNCPILLTNKEEINENTIYEIKRLNVAKVYIIGGEEAINENVVKSIEEENINIERIYGKDRYETSINIAEKIKQYKLIDSIILINGEYSLADAVSISPIAGNKNIPVIICKGDNLEIQKEWIKDNNIKNIYIIGGQDVINEEIEDYFYKENIDVDRIAGKDRYKTNVKVIKYFYNESKINKLFYCSGKSIDKNDEGIEAMLVVPLAAKEKSPVILLGDNLIEEQRELIKKKNIKSLVQVGYGVSEEAKKELHKIKESYIPPSIYYPQISKPQTDTDDNNKLDQPTNTEGDSKPEPPANTEGDSKPEPPANTEGDSKLEPPANTEGDSKPEPPTNIEGNDKPQLPTDSNENNTVKLSIKNSKISEDNKTITVTFNKDIYEGYNLKENIKIIVDEENVVNSIKGEEKYIKLNKYDSVEINKNELIIKLEDKLIGLDNSIIIEANSIKDNSDELRIENIEGENKKILFIGEKEKGEFINHINNTDADIIKLETDIEINKNDFINASNDTININKGIIIDGSNGEGNFKIINKSGSAKGIHILNEYIELKHLDLQQIYVYIKSQDNIKLKDVNIYLPNNNYIPCITMDYSSVEVKDLILTNDKAGIEVKSTNSGAKVSKLIIDGHVYNIKMDTDDKYKPSIISQNKIIKTDIGSDTEKANEIIIKDNKHGIDTIYKIITSKSDNSNYKIYEYYYK